MIPVASQSSVLAKNRFRYGKRGREGKRYSGRSLRERVLSYVACMLTLARVRREKKRRKKNGRKKKNPGKPGQQYN